MFAIAFALFLQIQNPAPTTPESRPARESTSVASVADKVVAIINNEVITKTEVDSKLSNLIATQGVKDVAAIDRARYEITMQLAHELLLTQAARKAAFDDKQIMDATRRRIEDEERRAGGRASLHRNIQAQGKSVAEWERDQKNTELKERLLMAEFGFDYRPEKEIVITPSILRAYYKEHIQDFQAEAMVNARMIRIDDARVKTHENARGRTKDIYDKIKSGADFADMAREFSDYMPTRGGNLGWLERRQGGQEPVVIDYIFTHEPGTLSEPIEVEGGFAIIKIEAKRPPGLRPFQDQDTQEEIARRIFMSKRRELSDALLRRLLSEAYVYPPDLFQMR